MKYLLASILVLFMGTKAYANYDELEQDILNEINMARTNPQYYAEYLKSFLLKFKEDKTFLEGSVLYQSKEGKIAVQEAITFLENKAPVGGVKYSAAMSKAGRDHANDLGPASKTGHYSQNGNDPEQRLNKYGAWNGILKEMITYTAQSARGHVIGLIVDDGVPSRGHRADLFNPGLKIIGVGCGVHKIYTTMCVIDAAGKFTEHPKGGAILIGELEE